MGLHAYQLDQLTNPPVIAQPEIIEIPDFSAMTDDELIAFAESIYNKYLVDECRTKLREALAASCLRRIRSALLGCSGPDQDSEFNTRILQIQKLTKVYCFGLLGIPMDGAFNGPRHLWTNEEIKERIFEFFSIDENQHDFQNTSLINDYIYLYCLRITRE